MVPPETTASRWAPSAAADGVGGAIPDDPRPQLGELLGGVAAGQHVEDAVELGPREVGVGVGAAHQRQQVVDRPLVHRRRRHHLLRQHVERLAGHAGRLDRALAHAPGDHGGLEQVAPPLGEEPAAGRLADGVPRAADPLQAGRHRLRRLDLHHQVDRAHVDPQLERGGGDQRRQHARASACPRSPAAARGRSSRGGRGRRPRRPARSAGWRRARPSAGC